MTWLSVLMVFTAGMCLGYLVGWSRGWNTAARKANESIEAGNAALNAARKDIARASAEQDSSTHWLREAEGLTAARTEDLRTAVTRMGTMREALRVGALVMADFIPCRCSGGFVCTRCKALDQMTEAAETAPRACVVINCPQSRAGGVHCKDHGAFLDDEHPLAEMEAEHLGEATGYGKVRP